MGKYKITVPITLQIEVAEAVDDDRISYVGEYCFELQGRRAVPVMVCGNAEAIIIEYCKLQLGKVERSRNISNDGVVSAGIDAYYVLEEEK